MTMDGTKSVPRQKVKSMTNNIGNEPYWSETYWNIRFTVSLLEGRKGVDDLFLTYKIIRTRFQSPFLGGIANSNMILNV